MKTKPRESSNLPIVCLGASRFEVVDVLSETPGRRVLKCWDVRRNTSLLVATFQESSLPRGLGARLLHDAQVRSELQVPGLVPVWDYGRSEDELFVMMPFVDGERLDKRLANGGISVSESLTLGIHLFSVLRRIHERGILHGNVESTNVLLGKNEIGELNLLGFGASLRYNTERLDNPEQLTVLQYMSPEEAGALDCDVGPSSDLYSAGIVLYECLTGQPPFRGASASAILREHLTARLPDLRSQVASLPRELNEVVQRLLRKDPQDRYQTAEAVEYDLRVILDSLRRGVVTPLVVGATDRRNTLTEPSFVARAQEMQLLESGLHAARSGNGGLAFVEGQSGSGKSRLMIETIKWARAEGFLVLRGQGKDQVGQNPYEVFQGIVDGLLAASEELPELGSRIRESMGDLRGALLLALPRLEPLLGPSEDAKTIPEDFREHSTIEALTHFLESIGTREQPAFLVLDDCQWADAVTYRLLRRWTTKGNAGLRPTMLLAGFRSEEVREDHPLRQIQPEYHVSLRSFQDREIALLVESMAGSLPESAVGTIQRLAGGSPFMASAVLRGLVESEALIPSGRGWEVDATALEDLQSSKEAAEVLARRIDLLPSDTVTILSIGAVLGKEFGLEEVSRLMEVPTAAAIRSLDYARERNLIWARADGAHFVFIHDQIRSALLKKTSPDRRRDLHLRVAEWYEREQPERVPSIAYHYDQANETKRATHYALLAAEQARQQFSLEIAEEQYRIAQRGTPEASTHVRFRIAEGLGDTLMLRGKYTEAEPLFEEAAELAHDDLAKAKVQIKQADLWFKRGDMERATIGFEATLRTLGWSVPTNVPMTLGLLGWEAATQVLHTWFPKFLVHRMRRLPTESERMAITLCSKLAYGYWFCRTKVQCLWMHLRGLNHAERYLPTSELAHVYSEHAPAMSLIPMFGRAIRYAEKSLALRRQFGDVWGEGQTLSFYSCVLYYASRFSECIEKGRASVRLLERTGDLWQVHVSQYQVAASLYHLGDLEAAMHEARESHRSGRELGDEHASSIILDVMARAARRSMPNALIEHELTHKQHSVQSASQLAIASGIAALYRKEWDVAVSELERAYHVAVSAGVVNAYTLPASAWLATAYREKAASVQTFSPRDARRFMNMAGKWARRHVRLARLCENDLPRALRELALLAAMRGKKRVAKQYLERSLAKARTQSAQLELALTLKAISELGPFIGSTDVDSARTESQSLLSRIQSPLAEQQRFARSSASLSLADRFDGVLESGRQIASALAPDLIFEKAKEAAQRLLRGEWCMLIELDASAESTAPYKQEYWNDAFVNSLVQESIQQKRAIVLEEDETHSHSSDLSLRRCGLSVPIRVRERIVACLCVTHSQIKNLFGKDEERLADFVATIAGAALENAAGFADLANLNATLEQRISEATDAIRTRANELATSNRELERTTEELLQAQRELQNAKEIAESANAAKSRFLATMSHEIRTPMNGILGMTELALKSDLNPKQRNCLKVVKQSGDALLGLLNDILDLSKIEAGRMELEYIPTHLHDLFYDAAKLMSVYAFKKRIDLLCHIRSNVPTTVDCDPGRLRQILVNLLGNAIKFTETGEVVVECELEHEGGTTPQLHVRVRDTGPGIPVDRQQAIFESFQQSDSSTTRRYGGTGLGLTISAELVELFGGRIWVESEVGVGSEFHFTIPLSVESMEYSRSPQVPPCRVLLVSDSASSAGWYRDVLQRAGASCSVFSSLQDAWPEIDRRSSPNEDTRTVLVIDSDFDHRWLDWFDTPEKVFALQSIKVLALLPSHTSDELLMRLNINAHDCLLKPISSEDLLRHVQATSDLPAVTSLAEPRMDDSEGMLVLVADDSEVNREIACGFLELFGHRFETVENGEQAVEAVRTRRFDVVLMDIEMPVLDGLEATTRIRQLPGAAGQTPILAMTAHALDGVEKRCMDHRMNGCLTKPIEPERLAQALEAYRPHPQRVSMV